ncbi:MAG: Txe/YoeB family addiction module toxin [Saprospiraceae bacterium]
MDFKFSEHGWEDFEYWIDTDTDVADKIRILLKEIKATSFKATGKPEPLKYNLIGYWSKRITSEHRLVYKIDDKKGVEQTCVVIQCRYHHD